MKKILLTLFLSALGVVLILGCSEDSSFTGQGDSSITMQIGKTYLINSSQSILRHAEITDITFETDINTGEMRATLIQGSAEIQER